MQFSDSGTPEVGLAAFRSPISAKGSLVGAAFEKCKVREDLSHEPVSILPFLRYNERKATSVGQQDLIRRAKQRDEAAWEEIYERHKQGIHRYVYYQVSDAPLAEDLMQEVFLKAVEAIDSFEFRGISLSAWLYRIARNLIINHYRRQPEQKELTLDECVAASEEDTSAAVEKRFGQRELWKALGGLTELQREVIILKFIEGFSNSEVAHVMGKPEGAIKSLQHRALAALRRILEEG